MFQTKLLISVRSQVRITTSQTRRSFAYFEGGKLADGTIFRRPLPAPSIELSSTTGTQLFAEALQEGTAKCFFRLMEQLHTQNEPEYCGLATLVTVLNALNIDPHRRWKGNWRFYSEELLDCCEPLSKVKTKGIDFDKLAGLARCNGLTVKAIRASEATLDEFRSEVLAASKAEEFSLALAYSRKALNQTGSGHYSPMGAYHQRSDHLLILDCARFKYRPHWVPVPLMYEAMRIIDPDTSLSRGFMRMTPVAHGPPPAAHVLAFTHKTNAHAETKRLPAILSEIALEALTARDFLVNTSDALERVFTIELKGHGCSSPMRKLRITEQLSRVRNWDADVVSNERILQRKALLLSLDHAYIAELLRDRPELSHEVIDWIKLPDQSGELAVELSFTRPHVQSVIDTGKDTVLSSPENSCATALTTTTVKVPGQQQHPAQAIAQSV